MNPDNKNLILAVTLSVLILVFYQLYFAPQPPNPNNAQTTGLEPDGYPLGEAAAAAATFVPQAERDIATIINAPRIAIENEVVEGSISLAGGRIDDVRLKDFKADLEKGSPQVSLFRRSGTPDAYFAEMFFTAIDGNSVNRAISRTALWQADHDRLTPDRPVTLSHRDGDMEYRIIYAIDEAYMIRATGEIINHGSAPATIGALARILRQRSGYSEWISYAGPMGYFNPDSGNVFLDYDDIGGGLDCRRDERFCTSDEVRAWVGISDKNWLTAIIPVDPIRNGFVMRPAPASAPDFDRIRPLLDDATIEQIDTIRTGNSREGEAFPIEISANHAMTEIGAGQTVRWSFDIFAGPKRYTVLDHYRNNNDIKRFTGAIDWGWLEFLAKPMLIVLISINDYVANFGVAILIMTVGIKLLFFPLANRSYHSMAKMRELAPKVQELRERFADDKQRQQQEMMALYREEKVNPASGCLPILLQIPVFFALYKVLYVTIEMRHAPFFGWVNDLSALDPTSVFNAFGLLPYSTAFLPDFLNIGVWPLLMGISMYIQMSLNPPPPDPVQAQLFKFMPVMFTFLLATFPVGLVIYWTWNNVLSIVQQWYIMRSHRRTRESAGS